jgi:hypothetical protein
MRQPGHTTSQRTARHGTAAYTLFFNLSHEAFADTTYFLVGGGRRYALTKVSDEPQVLAQARQTNAFLRAVPDDQITHRSENVVLASDNVTLSYLYADIDPQAGTWSMSGVYLLIPPNGAAAAYAAARTRTPSGPLPLSAKRRLYGLPAAQSAQDLREERALLDTTSHAATIVGAHPDLFSLEPTAANIVHSNHIDTSIDVTLLSTQLRRLGPATPQTTPGQPNPTGWGTLVPVIDDTTGQPFKNTQGQNKGRLQYQPSFHPDIAAAAGTALSSVTPAVKNDTSLGANVTGLNPDPNEPPNPALNGALWLRHDGFANTDQRGLAGVGDQALAMALKNTTPGDFYLIPSASASQNADGSVEVSLSLLNWALRFVGVYLQFLSTKTNPPTPIALSQIPEYTNNTIIPGHDSSIDTATEFFVGLLGPTFTVLGIPVAPGFLLPKFQVPASADMVRILSSGLSFQGSNNYPDTVLPGAIMTGVFNYGVTALMAAAGAGATFSIILKTVVIPLAQALAQELVAIISQALNSTGPKDLVDMLGKASFWEGQALAVAKTLLTYAAGGAVGVAVGKLAAAIVGEIGVAEAEDAIPLAGWISLGISIAVGVASIIETSVELSQVPWTDIDDLSFTHDLSVTILKDSGNPDADPPDPGDDTFPKAADHYKVTALFDDGTPRVQTLALPQPVPATLPAVVFPGVPLGGNVNVSVAFSQVPTDPFQPAGGVLLGKGSTGLIPNTLGATPTITIQELQFPITANTTYVHKQKTAVDPKTGLHVWDAKAAAPTVNAGNLVSDGPGTLYGFRSITVRQGTATAQGYVGYAWQGWNSGGAGPLDQMANLNTADAETGYVASAFDFTQPGVRLAYNMLSRGSVNFYLDTTDPNHLHVRQVTLDPTPTFDSPLSNQSWGVFTLTPDAVLLHPTGHLVSISGSTHTMATHRLPDAFMTDAEAAVHLLAQVKSGPGTRPGLMTTPAAATVAPDGTILVLEAGDPNAKPTPIPSRLQAFNLGANAIPFFTKQSAPYFLTLTATPNDQGWQYLDIAAEYTGLLYVLSYNDNTFLYRLDIYDPTQVGTTPISTTQDINAAKLTVDFWRNVYTLNYEVLQLPGPGITEPTVSLWVPTDSHTGANSTPA